MLNWFVNFTPEAEGDLDALDKTARNRIIEKLEWLEDNFDTITPLPLGNEWKGFYKFRVGDWRIIYRINWDESGILIAVIEHRSKVYKRRTRRL